MSSISFVDVSDQLRRIVISGRLDTPGVDSIASQLVQLTAAPKKGVVIDISSVKFLASIGIGALITSAKTVEQRGGKLAVVIGDSPSVEMSLEATGVDQMISIYKTVADAEKAAMAA